LQWLFEDIPVTILLRDFPSKVLCCFAIFESERGASGKRAFFCSKIEFTTFWWPQTAPEPKDEFADAVTPENEIAFEKLRARYMYKATVLGRLMHSVIQRLLCFALVVRQSRQVPLSDAINLIWLPRRSIQWPCLHHHRCLRLNNSAWTGLLRTESAWVSAGAGLLHQFAVLIGLTLALIHSQRRWVSWKQQTTL
jgi:hypothetical protein